MARTRTRSVAAAVSSNGTEPQVPFVLRHVMVTGGTMAEWGELSDQSWAERITSLGTVAADAGARWLTLRPFERGPGADTARPIAHGVADVGRCTVIVDPHPDGRDHLVVALRKLAESDQLTDAAVAPALLAPADVEPDLVLLLGTNERLPTSLVWELAYSELVYVPVTWAELESSHLAGAIAEFQGRHRRFGGLD